MAHTLTRLVHMRWNQPGSKLRWHIEAWTSCSQVTHLRLVHHVVVVQLRLRGKHEVNGNRIKLEICSVEAVKYPRYLWAISAEHCDNDDHCSTQLEAGGLTKFPFNSYTTIFYQCLND